MGGFPCLERVVSGSGQVRYRLGKELTDRYLEFVAGRCRPNTLRAAAFDLKAFFTVIAKEPTVVTPAGVFEFLAHQRGDRTVVRVADRESGLSARTIARRLSSVSGLYAYLVERGDTPVRANPVPRDLLTRRQAVTLVDHDTAMSTASILVQEDTHYRSRTAQPAAAAHRTTASQGRDRAPDGWRGPARSAA